MNKIIQDDLNQWVEELEALDTDYPEDVEAELERIRDEITTLIEGLR
ncbi:hypothetical protein KAR91_22145 [Candidatus Pacearchaeota archaeon]|nr:hypothetical protein [Candidatus Pacearchaeota archaeon]